MSAALPPPMPTNPLRRMAKDLGRERAATVPFPPGELRPSVARTRRVVSKPLPELMRCYRDYGPVFTIRVLHAPVTMMLGPEANHYMLVSNAKNFVWREGSMGDLIPLIGDGLLTIDGLAHKTARRLLLPAFHHEQVAASVETMVEEIDRGLAAWEGGETRVDIYDWSRHLALRIAMRALLGINPDARAGGHDPAEEWEAALGYYGRDLFVQSFRGPLTPWARMLRGHRRLTALVTQEIEARRRGDSAAAERGGIVSLLMDAQDADGEPLSDEAIRDHVLTLLFAGHDTTTATITFMLYELARNPHELPPLRDELDDVLGDRLPTADDLARGLPRLEMVLDETLRMYPPAWIGPRRSVEPVRVRGPPDPRRRSRQLLLVGQPSHPGGVPRPGRVRAGPLRAGGEGPAAEGRLCAVRRRLTHLHRDALRPDGGQGDGGDDAAALRLRPAPRLRAPDPPDTDAGPA